MANTIVRGQMIFHDENALAHGHGKKAVAAGKGKSSLAAPKKNGAGFASRKALNDITNKAKLQPPQVSSKNKNVESDFDIAKEGFLHDHRKCIQEQQNNHWEDNYFSELILVHGQDNNIKEVIHEGNIKEKDESTYITLDELKEIPMEEFSDWLECSPPNSPIDYHSSLPSSPLPWRFETVEFKLKEDDDSI